MESQNVSVQVPLQRGRIDELDALRGLAAFVVIWCHFRFAFQDAIPNTPLSLFLRPLFAGHESVTLFFILSGFVLALPVWSGRQPSYMRYLLRRAFRIYLPFVAALLLAAMGSWLFGESKPQLTAWFHHTWSNPVTTHLLFSQLLIPSDGQLNTAFWSLRYEMEMSILFPFICWLLLRVRWFGGVALIFMMELCLRLAASRMHGYESELMISLRWSEFFIAGAILSMKRQWIASMFARIGSFTLGVIFLMSAGLYYSYFLTFYSGNIPNLAPHDTLIGLGAVGFLLLAQYAPTLRRILNHPLSQYLGKISYSMYLVHGTVLFALLHLLYGKISVPALVAIYLPTTLAASHIFHKLVEEPATKIGKALSSVSRTENSVVQYDAVPSSSA